MSLRRLGVPERFIDLLIEYDREGQVEIVTAYGCSSDILGDEEGFFHAERGFGQGSDEGPMGWTAFYDIPLTMVEQTGSGYEFDNPWGDREVATGQSFADDTAWFEEETLKMVMRCQISQTFLEFMGCGLSVEKCVNLSLKWNERGDIEIGRNRIVMNGEGEFRLNPPEGWGIAEMKPLKEGQSYKYLGVDVSGEGGWKKLLEMAKEKLETQTTALMSKRISPEGAWIVCNSVLKPQIMYRTFVTNESEKDISEMERMARRVFFKNAKLPITFPLDLLGAHENRLGMGWIPWNDELGVQKVGIVLQAMNSKKEMITGRLIEIMLPSLQRMSCRSGSALGGGDPGCRVKSWLWGVWNWMKNFGFSIE